MPIAAPPLADVQARIAAIQARFPAQPPGTTAAGAPATTTAGAPATTAAPAGRFVAALRRAEQVVAPAVADGTADGERVVALAKQHLGVPYVWGAEDPETGFDCSGLVQYVYGKLGVDLPRVSRDQARAGQPVASLADARPGDLVAFGSPVDHIGIYAGGGKMVVAPQRGDVVKVQDVYRTPTAIRRILP